LFWHYSVPTRTTRWLAGLCWLGFWGLLALHRVRRGVDGRRLAPTVAAGVLAVTFGLSAWAKAHGDRYAVASDERVAVHYGTSEDETVRFELYAGDRVIVDRRENGWARVITADGERGWARDEALAFVGPPYERPALPGMPLAPLGPADAGTEGDHD